MIRRPAALALLALAACPFHPRAPDPAPTESEWARVRDAASRRADLYDGLVHRATATATYMGWNERAARARRLAKWLAWTDEELARHLEQQRDEAARFDEFVISFYVIERRADDLDSPQTQWRVAVEAGGRSTLPARITAVTDKDLTYRGLFPWVGAFETVYVARFPRGPEPLEGSPFVLRLASAFGQLALDFGAPAKPIQAPRIAP